MRRQGKGAKSRARDKRAARKRGIKMANKAKYAEWRRVGQNTKSNRAKQQSKKKKLFPAFTHRITDCGNLGCKRCHPPAKKRI